MAPPDAATTATAPASALALATTLPLAAGVAPFLPLLLLLPLPLLDPLPLLACDPLMVTGTAAAPALPAANAVKAPPALPATLLMPLVLLPAPGAALGLPLLLPLPGRATKPHERARRAMPTSALVRARGPNSARRDVAAATKARSHPSGGWMRSAPVANSICGSRKQEKGSQQLGDEGMWRLLALGQTHACPRPFAIAPWRLPLRHSICCACQRIAVSGCQALVGKDL